MPAEQIYMGIGAAVLVILAGLRRLFRKRQESVPKLFMWMDIGLFLGCFSLLAWYFYQKDLTPGLWAVGMGAMGIGKYLWDGRKK